ncbi:MAG: hypothetical protein HC904_17125 [Blastochloris sp.]|nr:hypothetical protein [Blastochloris sp.]
MRKVLLDTQIFLWIAAQEVKLTLTFEATLTGGISPKKLEKTRTALRELGLDEDELKSS